MRFQLWLVALIAAAVVDQNPRLSFAPGSTEQNVLVILADDLGFDDLATVSQVGWTPNIDAFSAQGLVCPNAFANPTCSPTRDSLLTSRWGGKLDGTPCLRTSGFEIPLEVLTLPKLVSETHSTRLFGKWHLGRDPAGAIPLEDVPTAYGYGGFDGVLANLIECDSSSYSDWQHVHDGTTTPSTDYEPRVVLDALKAWWSGTSGQKLAVWCPALPHGPMHWPPVEELPDGYPAEPQGATQRHKYEAMIAALDRQVGEMLALVDFETTLVIFMGDNGTPSNVAPPGFGGKAKGTAYDRGIHVPCIVAAPGVTPGIVTRMVHPADIMPTVAVYLGLSAPQGIQGVSIGAPANVRAYVVAIDYFDNVFPVSSAACVRTSSLKLMAKQWHTSSPQWLFFKLATDPTESNPLTRDQLSAPFQLAYDQMHATLLAALPK